VQKFKETYWKKFTLTQGAVPWLAIVNVLHTYKRGWHNSHEISCPPHLISVSQVITCFTALVKTKFKTKNFLLCDKINFHVSLKLSIAPIFFLSQCQHMSSQTSWSPPLSRLWLKCNRLLKLGRPVGAVRLSRWEWWWDERWIWGARGGLNLISTNYSDHGHHGRLPFSRKNAHCRAWNRTQDLMVSSQELWPPSHEAGRIASILKTWKLLTEFRLFIGLV